MVTMADDLPDYRSNVVSISSLAAGSVGRSSHGGGNDGMEPRIARLEADMDHVKRRLDELAGRVSSLNDKVSSVGIDVAVIKEKMTHVPSKTYAIATSIAMVAALAALILFADRLKMALGLG
jgi:hypothetical protein